MARDVSALTQVIAVVRATPVVIPYDRPIQTAVGTMPHGSFVLVDVETEAGVRGYAYVRCYTPLALAPVAQLVRGVGASLQGSPLEPIRLWTELRKSFQLLGVEGLVGLALNAIDMALWDALARSADLPLVALLGGHPHPVTAYKSLRSMQIDDALREAEEAVGLGFTAIKVKLGSGSGVQDRELLHELREAVGSEVDLMCDYNQTLTYSEALARMKALDEIGLRWIEEPLPARDLVGLSRLVDARITPIQAGESWWSPDECAASVRAHASDLVMLDVARIGGVTGWLRAAAIAEAAGLKISSHTFPEFSVHLLAAAPNADLLEWMDSAADVSQAKVKLGDGTLEVPDAPGVGMVWDDDAVQRLSAKASLPH